MSIHKPHSLYCLCCGKLVTHLIDGKYCSDECKEAGGDVKKGSIVFCNNCGVSFIAIQTTSRFCPDCYGKSRHCRCFYPSLKDKWQKENDTRKKLHTVPAAAKASGKKGRMKQFRNIRFMSKEEILKFCTIDEILELARESGFESYGKYTAALRAEIEAGKRRKEG